MKKVLVQLTGDNIDIDDIKLGFNATEWKISKESDGYYLTSEEFDEDFDHNEILSQVNLLLDVLNGAANIIHRDHKKIGTGSLIEVDENGQRNIFISIHERVIAGDRCNAELVRAGNIVESSPSKIQDWVTKAKTHESVRDALHFFNEITWWNLYKVFEIIRDDVKGQKQLYTIINKAELSRFTRAAQSRELIGDDARHASKSFTPPHKKLTLEDASNTIIKLFENWINSK
jgi:hypothetical protein